MLRRRHITLIRRLVTKIVDPEAARLRTIYDEPPVPLAGQYPDVPQPDDPMSPMVIAARWGSRDLYGEDMPGVAADLLEKGYDTPSLRRLAGEMNVACSADVEPLVARVFRELGVRYPLTELERSLIASRQIAREVIAGKRNAWTSATHLEIRIWGWIPKTTELETIFRINDELSWDFAHRRRLSELETVLLDAFAALAIIEIPTRATSS